MPPQLQIVDTVLKKLGEVHSPIVGCLYCIMYEGKVLIVGVGFELRPTVSKGAIWYDSVQQIYPTGIDWCGIFSIEEDLSQPEDLKLKETLKDVLVTNNPLYMRKDLNSDRLEVYYADGANLKFCEHHIIKESEFLEKFVFLNLLGLIHVTLPLNPSHSRVKREIDKLSARVASGMWFRLGESNIYLNKYSTRYDDATLGRVFDSLRKEKEFRINMEVLKVHALFPAGPYANEVNRIVKPVIYDYTYPSKFGSSGKEQSFKILLNLPFDALCVAHRERSMNDVYDLLLDAAERTVMLCESYLLRYIHSPLKVHNLRALHFFPTELAHPLSLVLSTEHDDEKLIHIRRQVHAFLNIGLDKPCFRQPNGLIFKPATHITYPLMNVHIGIRPSGIRSDHSKSSITKGAYYYYHYMMDGINDNGWGCAYRSFQTIFSWFKLQGYTTMEVPTHLEIQEWLVHLKDKPPKFKGSKTWIGSTEVAFVLEATAKSPSCILNVASGSEMGSIGTAVYEHFEEEGIPIMIGGGVLAHTILGIDIDEESGDMKFLVLDPHYCENEDINKIQRKGFVGWKGIDFWDPKSFYNLCLPRRPRCY